MGSEERQSWSRLSLETKDMGMIGRALVPTLLYLCPTALGHGNMVWPMPWWDINQVGAAWDHNGRSTNLGCGVLDLPHTQFEDKYGREPDCMKSWFSNSVLIPGNATIPNEMDQSEIPCEGQDGKNSRNRMKFPWHAPGTAPVFGPCGTLGAIPLGCNGDGKGNFGDCCTDHCDSFALGKNMEEYEWPDAPVTEWKAGSSQEVGWYVGANHAGGYSYRICKMPQGGITHLTEECFKNGHLDFIGNQQWVQYAKDKKSGHRTELRAKQTAEGTYPEGSMWRANQLIPRKEVNGDVDYSHGHIYDKIQVPGDLEPGEYVVSFRWDSKCSPQVWGSCATVRIV